MGRSLKKGPFVDAKLVRKVERQKESGSREPITTWCRAATVIPDFVGHTFMTYQPLQPEHYLYWHQDRYHNYYDGGRGLNRTKAGRVVA